MVKGEKEKRKGENGKLGRKSERKGNVKKKEGCGKENIEKRWKRKKERIYKKHK